MIVFDEQYVEREITPRGGRGWNRLKRPVRRPLELGDLDRPPGILERASRKRRITDVEEPQRLFAGDMSGRLRSLQRMGDDAWQVREERLIVDDVVVCSRLQSQQRCPDIIRTDDNHRSGQSKAAHVIDERGAALILELGLDDQCRDIPVVVDPGQGTRHVAGPLERYILC